MQSSMYSIEQPKAAPSSASARGSATAQSVTIQKRPSDQQDLDKDSIKVFSYPTRMNPFWSFWNRKRTEQSQDEEALLNGDLDVENQSID